MNNTVIIREFRHENGSITMHVTFDDFHTETFPVALIDQNTSKAGDYGRIMAAALNNAFGRLHSGKEDK